jgi:hypothetical protein
MSEASGIARPMPYKALDHLTHRIAFFFFFFGGEAADYRQN